MRVPVTGFDCRQVAEVIFGHRERCEFLTPSPQVCFENCNSEDMYLFQLDLQFDMEIRPSTASAQTLRNIVATATR